MKDTVVLSADLVLDHKAIDKMCVGLYLFVRLLLIEMDIPYSLLSGYSRFPVHEPGNPLAFIGTLLIKRVRIYPTFL
jgi:metal transporter CNNM